MINFFSVSSDNPICNNALENKASNECDKNEEWGAFNSSVYDSWSSEMTTWVWLH